MTEQKTNLGKLQSIHVVAPAYIQRAAIVAVLSFIFFLAMMIGVYVRQNFVYFLLATAFLIVNIFTLLGWMMLRRKVLKVYENGFGYQKFNALWNEIEKIETANNNAKFTCTIVKKNGESVVLNDTIDGIGDFAERIKKEC